jgi:hypothetical protein
MLNESLVKAIKSEPKTAAAQQAKKMGLTYVGFGRYADKTGNVAYIVQDEKLIPFKKDEDIQKMFSKADETEKKAAIKAKIAPKKPKPKVGDKPEPKPGPAEHDLMRKEAGGLLSANKKLKTADNAAIRQHQEEIKAVDAELSSYYAGIFSEEEEAAIQAYTGSGFESINQYLYNGHAEGTDYYMGKQIEDGVAKLDAAFEEALSPIQYSTYTGLSDRYKAESFEIGKEYVFKGYVSSSLDHGVATTFAGGAESKMPKPKAKTGATPGGGGVMLELEVPKGGKAIYLANTSDTENEYETLLPRGSRIKVVSGPHTLPGDVLKKGSGNMTIFKCKIVQNE